MGKKVVLTDCELTDPCCEVLKDLFENNQLIEEIVLDKNKISGAGASLLADGLAKNSGVKTMNLLQQSVKSFGEECLDRFVIMYATNITLTKLTWRLDSRKSFSLAKLQTRNIEIQKRKAAGKDYNDILPDNLKSGASPEMTKRKSTVEEVEKHAEEVAKDLPAPPAEEEAAVEAPAEGGEAPTEAPAPEGE